MRRHSTLDTATADSHSVPPRTAALDNMEQQEGAVTVNSFRVEHGEGFSMPCVTLRDRRAGGNPLVKFVFQRHLESVLYGRTEGSSGPIWKMLNATGMGTTALPVSKASVVDELISQAEYDHLMQIFKSALPASIVDPSSLGRIRVCTLLPLATAAALARTFGRAAPSFAFLRAFNQTIPEAWTLNEEAEANAAQLQYDYVLEDKLDELNFEAEDVTFAEELTGMASFVRDGDDETRMRVYIMARPAPTLVTELNEYILHRTKTFAARRQGAAVKSVSAESDKVHLLRFCALLLPVNVCPPRTW